MIPAADDNLQDFAVQSIAALLSRTAFWQQAVGADCAAAAMPRIVTYGVRQLADGSQARPPYPFAIVSTPDEGGTPELTDAGGGFGVSHDWKCGVIVQIYDAANINASYGAERERFTALHNGVIFALRKQFKSEFGEGDGFQPTGDYRLVGYRHTALGDADSKDGTPYFFAEWALDTEGTFG